MFFFSLFSSSNSVWLSDLFLPINGAKPRLIWHRGPSLKISRGAWAQLVSFERTIIIKPVNGYKIVNLYDNVQSLLYVTLLIIHTSNKNNVFNLNHRLQSLFFDKQSTFYVCVYCILSYKFREFLEGAKQNRRTTIKNQGMQAHRLASP